MALWYTGVMGESLEAVFETAPAEGQAGGSELEGLEGKITPESVEALPDVGEPGAFYRGLGAEDALRAAFGKLELDAHPRGQAVGSRDNASLNLIDAIPFAPTSETKGGRKFLCAIGFDALPAARVEDSFLGRFTSRRITGPVRASEVVLRFAGKEPGQPQPEVRYFAPQEFFEWYRDNVARL